MCRRDTGVLWQGRTTKPHCVKCVEEEDTARGVAGRRDTKRRSRRRTNLPERLNRD